MKEILHELAAGQTLGQETAARLIYALAEGVAPLAQMAAALSLISSRGLTLTELRGFVGALRELGTPLDLATDDLLDVCGTGGDGKNTFNISTLTAFVLAGAGVKVAKHGNYSATSHCGSSNVLEYLGLRFTADEGLLRRDLDAANLCLLHAPLFQPALRVVGGVRRDLGLRTFFNLCGPLLNPARPHYNFIGVAEPSALRLYRYFLETENSEFCLVHTQGGFDEITLTGACASVNRAGAETLYPDNWDYAPCQAAALHGGTNVAEAAQIFLAVLRGTATHTQRAVTLANAAHALRLVRLGWSVTDCLAACAEALDGGAAHQHFLRLQQLHNP